MKSEREKYYLERVSELENEVADLEAENGHYISVYESLLNRIAGYKVDLASQKELTNHHIKNIRKLNDYIKTLENE